MTLIDKLWCFLGDSTSCRVNEQHDDDKEFEHRVEKILQEQEEVETRLRALGTTVNVYMRRAKDGHVDVSIERHPDGPI